MTIRKFPLEVTDKQRVAMPRGARPLAVQVQYGVPCLWVLCDPEAPASDRLLAIHGTGHRVPEDPGVHIGSFQMHGGGLVFHVFDGGEAPCP